MAENKPCFYALTLGCKINQYETQSLTEAWEQRGWERSGRPEQAGVILINSCAVTAGAVRDTRKAIRRMARQAPGAKIIVSGCAAQVFARELEQMPEVDVLVRQMEKYTLGPNQAGSNLDLSISGYPRARVPVRIQDGCTHGCTYCIVPRTRGGGVSCPPERVLAQIRVLMAGGAREISLCGINLAQYGQDLDAQPDFWDLLCFLDSQLKPEWLNRARLRLSSLEPSRLDEKARDTLAQCREMLCPHLHISLQSGSPFVLQKMGRGHYRPEDLLLFTRRLPEIWPVFALGADLLFGFPGETKQLYEQSKEVVRNLPLTYAHIFPYSARPGTAAAKFPGRISREDKKSRCREISALVQEKKMAFYKNLLQLSRVYPVLETEHGGTNEYFVPTRFEQPHPGKSKALVPARPVRVENNALIAEAMA